VCLPFAHVSLYGILSRLRDDRRRDALRRFASFMSYGFRRFIDDNWIWSASRRSVSVCQHRVLWLPSFLCAFCGILRVGVATIVVATLSVRLPASCPIASRGSSTVFMKCCVGDTAIGVATLGVFLQTSCDISSLDLSALCEISRRWDDRHRDARRRFVSVVSCGISGIICAIDGILCRRRDVYRHGYFHVWLASVMYVISVMVIYLWVPWKNYPQTRNLHRDSNPVQFLGLWS
jgi:hypothetical protein